MTEFNNFEDLNENKMNKKELSGYPELVLKYWFIDNFKKLSYDQIVGGSHDDWRRSVPDFVMLKNNERIKVELETFSSHFFLHKHTTQQVDEVVCFVKDKELPVKIIEIKNIINKEILDKYSEKAIYQQKCNELLLYDNNWILIKDLIKNTSNVYEYLDELSQSNPKKFLEIYEEFCKRKREKSRRDYENHQAFSIRNKPNFNF